MSNLIVDSETSGLWRDELDPLDPGQPHMVQLGAQLYDDAGIKRAHMSCVIKPEGWSIEPEAEAHHGISTSTCNRYGVPLVGPLATLAGMVAVSRRIVGHNIEFDRKVIAAAIHRAGGAGLWWKKAAPKLFCTMEASTAVVGLPAQYGIGFKFPSLGEAVAVLAPELAGPIKHDADADIAMTFGVYLGLKARGLAPADEAFAMEFD